MDLRYADLVGGEVDNRADRVAIGIEIGDQRHAHGHWHAVRRQPAEIVHHPTGGAAGPGVETRFIGVFEIGQQQIQPGQRRGDVTPRNVQTGFDGGVDAGFAAAPQQLRRDLRLHKGFAAGQRYTTAAAQVERLIPHHLGHDIVEVDRAAAQAERAGRAGGGQRRIVVCADGFAPQRQRALVTLQALRAALGAQRTAAQAQAFVKQQIRVARAAFGVLAPAAAQRAPF